ncbi:MAG: hypothetical protein H6934_03030 [Burkholderiaceae bacterium]|nr:hypothetical protein [Burkholderiaceae bacterium]
MSKTSDRLQRAAAGVAELRGEFESDPLRVEVRRELRRWQAGRLARTHADLLASPRYASAARFFLDDLYGAKDFSARDAALVRVVPTLAKTLPSIALETIADAVEIDLLSERYDRALADWLYENGRDVPAIDEAGYAAAYRATATREQRLHQIALVSSVGESLDTLVRVPMIGRLLKMMGGPARLAGVEPLHDFLLRGYEAFRSMKGARGFLAQIVERETAICQHLFDGASHGWVDAEGGD